MSNIILGQLPLSFHNKVINFIILYMKQYIFCCLMSNKTPCLIGFLYHLKLKYNIERYATIQTGKLQYFENLWDSWKDILAADI